MTAEDVNGVPTEAATWCLTENSDAAEMGTVCAGATDCRTGICHLGMCTEICDTDETCGPEFRCATVAAYRAGTKRFTNGCPLAFSEAASLSLCLPEHGLLVHEIGAFADGEAVALDIPPGAASFMLIAEAKGGDANDAVGFDTLVGPGWTNLYELPSTIEKLVQQPVRYVPDTRISSMLVPNTPDMEWTPGTHCAFVLSTSSKITSTVTLIVKMAPEGDVTAGVLDLNIYLMNLKESVCGVSDLRAATAPTHKTMSWALSNMAEIYDEVGITLGDVRYFDRLDTPLLDVVSANDPTELAELFSLGTDSSGYSVDIFIVREIEGALGVAGGVPGPPGRHAMPHAGVVVSAESACNLNLPNVVAHEVGHFLGLFHTGELDGTMDNISDTEWEPENVMSQSGYGREFTEGQGFVMRRHANVAF